MYKRCLMILADGARADVLRDLADKGELPSISEHLIGPGSLRAAVTAFPSTTGPAYLPYLTGCYPGTCNLPGIRWFDKDHFAENPLSKDRFRSYVGAESFYMNRDLAADKATLFELIPRSANIFSSINRGVSFEGNKSKFSRIWYWYYAHLTDRWGLVDEAAGEKVVAALEDDPEFLFVVFPAIDEYSHLSSPFHPRTTEAYRGLDRSIGRIVADLKRRGWWEETMICIVSDHGLSETSRHFALNQFLEKDGLSVLYYPKIVFKWRFEAASMVSGNAMANVYFKNRDGWKGRATWEQLTARPDRLIDRLAEQPEVDLLATQREDGSILVKSARGEAAISMNGKIRYEIRGSDPFGYTKLPEAMTDREALALTDGTDYPDAPAQLLQIFRSQRAGDVILSAAKGSDLRLRYEIHEHKSSHGSLHWEHMKVPLVTNVRLPEGPVRTVDVFPTVLKLLGRPIPSGIDGISLV
ncbi:MAG TPA: alkaline phosphatase family protein [bacterium]|nr:alkaline phosphatase family protein [bacterium]